MEVTNYKTGLQSILDSMW